MSEFKYKIDEVVIPVIPPFFGLKGQKQVMICQIKEHSIQKEGKAYVVHCFGDMGVRTMYEDWLSNPVDLFKKEGEK